MLFLWLQRVLIWLGYEFKRKETPGFHRAFYPFLSGIYRLIFAVGDTDGIEDAHIRPREP